MEIGHPVSEVREPENPRRTVVASTTLPDLCICKGASLLCLEVAAMLVHFGVGESSV